jgi:predicted kinase
MDFYNAAATAQVYTELCERAVRIAQANVSAIVDATFADPDARTMMEDCTRHACVRLIAIFMTTNTETRIARIKQRGPDVSDANADLVRKQEKYDVNKVTWIKIDASGSRDQTLRHVRDVVLETSQARGPRESGKPKT